MGEVVFNNLMAQLKAANDAEDLRYLTEKGKRIIPVERHSEMMYGVYVRMYQLSLVDGLESVMDEGSDYLKKLFKTHAVVLCMDRGCSDEFMTRVSAHPVFGEQVLDITHCTPAQLQIYLTTGIPKKITNFHSFIRYGRCVPDVEKWRMIMNLYRVFRDDPEFPTDTFMNLVSKAFNQRYEEPIRVILDGEFGITPNSYGRQGYTLLTWYVTHNQIDSLCGRKNKMTLDFCRYLLEKGVDPRLGKSKESCALAFLRCGITQYDLVCNLPILHLFTGPVTWSEEAGRSNRFEVDPASGLGHYQELSIDGVKDVTGKVRVVGKQTVIYEEVGTFPTDRVIVNPDGTYTVINVLVRMKVPTTV